ncbi:MAG: hypothetical protein ACI9H9_001950 [Pseudoalteromonas tetraodonis]|jgi:hypothetical protein|nr:MAG: hypothetical protein COB48_08960 [Pseudoalteromonas sp.]
MVIVFSFTLHSLLFVQKDLKEILFTTEGAEHTEEMIFVFSVKRVAPRCTLWCKKLKHYLPQRSQRKRLKTKILGFR